MADGKEDCQLSSFILWDPGTQFINSDITLFTINGITIIFAFLCNLVIALAMKKRHLIKTPCHILNFSLSLVDFVANLVAKPLYIDLRMALYDKHVTCYTLNHKAKVTESAIIFFVGCSFIHIVCIARDRCDALCQPLLYRTDRKMKGTRWLACACWISWGVIVTIIQWVIPEHTRQLVRVSTAVLLLVSLAGYQLKTAVVVHQYNHSVISDNNLLEVQRLILREKKVLADTRVTLAAFFVLFIPTVVLSVAQPSGVYANTVFPWSMTITLFNCTLNPLIQFWRNRLLLRAVISMFLRLEE